MNTKKQKRNLKKLAKLIEKFADINQNLDDSLRKARDAGIELDWCRLRCDIEEFEEGFKCSSFSTWVSSNNVCLNIYKKETGHLHANMFHFKQVSSFAFFKDALYDYLIGDLDDSQEDCYHSNLDSKDLKEIRKEEINDLKKFVCKFKAMFKKIIK